MILLGILVINISQFIDYGACILKLGGKMNDEIRPRILTQFNFISASNLLANMRLLINANVVDIVNRIDNLSKLLISLILLTNLVFKFLF